MSDPNDSTLTGTSNDGKALLSSAFLEFCAKVRTNDPSILPEPGQPFMIRQSSQKELIELADALLENTSVTYLKLETRQYMKSSAGGNGQVRAYQQALATYSLERRVSRFAAG
jgi:hypothetical protein